jgi:hypothetical protein
MTTVNNKMPGDVVKLSDFFPTAVYTPDADHVVIKIKGGETITLTASNAREAAKILAGMMPAKTNFKGVNRMAANAKELTLRSAANFGAGLVKLAAINERLAAEALHQGIGSSVTALIPEERGK